MFTALYKAIIHERRGDWCSLESSAGQITELPSDREWAQKAKVQVKYTIVHMVITVYKIGLIKVSTFKLTL